MNIKWKSIRLKKACEINNITLGEDTLPDWRMQYLDIGSVDSEGNVGTLETHTFARAPSRARRRVKPGDTVISTVRTYLKAIAHFEKPPDNLIASTGFAVLTPKKEFDSRFLWRAVQDYDFIGQVVANSEGVGYPAIAPSRLANLPISFPPLPKQRRIAAYLDQQTAKIDRLINLRQRQIALLKEQRAALIQQAVTRGLNPNVPMKDSGLPWLGEIPAHWDATKIRRYCLVKRGASPRPIDDPKYFDDNGDYSWVRISDVTASEKYLTTTEQRLSDLGASLSVKREPGDIFVSICASIGKPIITKIKCCIHDGFVWFERLKLEPEYLFYLFSSGEMFKGLGNWGTQLNLNTDIIGDIKIPIPSINEQRYISEHLDEQSIKFDTLHSTYSRQLTLLAEYRAALIHECVTGKCPVSLTEQFIRDDVEWGLHGDS